MQPPPLPTISRAALIRLAEKADGLRGSADLILVYDPAGSFDIVKKGQEGACISLLGINSNHDKDFKGAPRKAVVLSSTPSLERKNGQPVGEVDAWFTSPAAVEKFLIPYYARTRGAAFAEKLRVEYFGDGSLLALIHEPPSEPEGLVERTTMMAGNVEATALTLAVQSLLGNIGVVEHTPDSPAEASSA